MPLILLPNVLGPVDPKLWLAPVVIEAVSQIDGLIAESERAGRRFLSYLPTKRPYREIPIAVLPRKLLKDDIDFLLEPVGKETWGLVSDAGLPCLADPGSELVAEARRRGIQVKAYPGPSSLFLALMLSGLKAQRFAFHGYLRRERAAHLLELERRAKHDDGTQLFIEAPYRNQETLKVAVESLAATSILGVAWNLTLPNEGVVVETVRQWRKIGESKWPDLDKNPTVFMVR